MQRKGCVTLRKGVGSLGRNANATKNMQGNYFGTAPFLISPAEGVGAYVSNKTVSACADSGSTCSSDEMTWHRPCHARARL